MGLAKGSSAIFKFPFKYESKQSSSIEGQSNGSVIEYNLEGENMIRISAAG